MVHIVTKVNIARKFMSRCHPAERLFDHNLSNIIHKRMFFCLFGSILIFAARLICVLGGTATLAHPTGNGCRRMAHIWDGYGSSVYYTFETRAGFDSSVWDPGRISNVLSGIIRLNTADTRDVYPCKIRDGLSAVGRYSYPCRCSNGNPQRIFDWNTQWVSFG